MQNEKIIHLNLKREKAERRLRTTALKTYILLRNEILHKSQHEPADTTTSSHSESLKVRLDILICRINKPLEI